MIAALDMEAPARMAVNEVIPVAGVVPLTTVDFPERLALVVFMQGCSWRCAYCHNVGLRKFGQPTAGRWQHVCDLLDERQGFLEAVVFSGGEPTLHSGLATAMQTVRRKGFLVGLHTAGISPEHLSQLLPWLDWVGLDIKAPFDERYIRLTGDDNGADKALASLRLLQASGVLFQLRTTVGPGALSEPDFAELRQQLHRLDAPEPVRQEVRSARDAVSQSVL